VTMAKKEEVNPADQEDEYSDDDIAQQKTEDGEAAGSKRKRKRKRKKKNSNQQEAGSTPGNDTVEDGDNTGQSMVEHTVYVEGIPFDSSSDDVKGFFVAAGIDDIRELRLPTWQDSGRLRGYGHIHFDSKESYDKALKLSGQNLGKRYLTIQAANTQRNNTPSGTHRQDTSKTPPPPDCRTLFVNNLSYQASEDDILQAVQKLGVTIPDDGVRIARNSVTRHSKGFCYIDFETPEDAQRIMAASHRLTVKGRLVRLDWDTGRMKGSYRADSGRLWSREVREKKRTKVSD